MPGVGPKPRGADLVATALADAGVRKVFALSGNHVMALFDALFGSRIEIVHVRHEAAAVHMADAWGRLTGQPGIAIVTGGPGHANALGALYTALAADSPLVLLSGHAALAQLGRGAFQEMAQVDVARPLTKASWHATSAQSLGREITRALSIATAGRPGPVHLSLPVDLLEARVEPDDAGAMRGHAAEPGDAAALGHGAAFDHAAASGRPSSDLDPRALANCAETIAGAARALVIAGSSFSSARARTRLARFTAISAVPALVMESPRGVADPALGALSEVLAEADLLVLLGKPLDFTLRFGDPATIAAGASFILIDGDESRLQRSVDVATRRLALRACASPHAVLDALGPALQPGTASRARAGWADAVAAAVSFRPPNWATLDAGDSAPVHPAQLGRALQRWIDRNPRTVFVSDGGEVEQWAQASVRAGERLINGVAGAIGTAVPFAIAARAACPDAPVLAVTGDGSFGFHMAEFDTALRHALPFVAVIGNDDRWNAEYQIQLREYGAARAQGCELAKATRYERVVEALGGHGEYVRHAGELDGAIERAFASARAACVNVRIAGEAAPAVRRTAIDCAGSRRSS